MLKKAIVVCLLVLFAVPIPCRASFSNDINQFEQKYSNIYQSIDPALRDKMESFLQDVVDTVVKNYDNSMSLNDQINYVVTMLLTNDPQYNQDLLPFLMGQMGNQDQYRSQITEMKAIVLKEVQARMNAVPPLPGGGIPIVPVIPPPAIPLNPLLTAIADQTSANRTVISEQAVDRQVTTTPQGQTVETVTLKEEVKTEIAKAITEGKTSVQITIAPAAQADKTVVDISASIMQSSAGLGLAIGTKDAVLELPKALVDTLAVAGQKLAITVERGTAADSTAQMNGVQGTEGAKVLGTPTVIHTEIKGSTSVTLPLTGVSIPTDAAAQADFLKTLAIFVAHSDGEKQVIQGSIVKDAQGNPVGISFKVDKFSTFAIIQVPVPVVSFNDTVGHWAVTDIQKMIKLGLVSGVSSTEFAPERNITRAEFAALLVRALGITPTIQVSGRFSDVPADKWYFNAVNTAADKGLLSGYANNYFGPNDLVTREQMATMITRSLSYKGKNSPSGISGSAVLNTFADSGQISSWAINSVAGAVQQGIIKGRSEVQFAPLENASRAEAAVMVLRMYNLL